MFFTILLTLPSLFLVPVETSRTVYATLDCAPCLIIGSVQAEQAQERLAIPEFKEWSQQSHIL